MTVINQEMENHDREARALKDQTLLAACSDLWNRKVHDRRDQESRWIMERRAALLREVKRRKLSLA